MNKIYILLVLMLAVFSSKAQIVNIPDANFKAHLLEASPNNNIAKNSNSQNIKIDINNDGEIQISEALTVYKLDVSISSSSSSFSSDISSLSGIEAFINLTSLNCSWLYLTSLDFTQNTNLTYLDCGWNQLTSLDISQNIGLTSLNCTSNQLTSLDVSQNISLISLNCADNQLTSLDVTQNTNLTYLNCSWNQLTNLDVSQNISLTNLGCDGNQLTNLDVSQNIGLTHLSCDGNQLTNLDVSQNIGLTHLSCGGNQLTSLDVGQNTNLTYLDCSWNQLASLDVSQNIGLTHLSCDGNQFTNLDVNQNIGLTHLSCGSNQLTNLDVSQNIGLIYLNCSWNQLTNLDISQNTNLEHLYCSHNQLVSLNTSQNSLLYYLIIDHNPITSLDLSQNLLLNSLSCSYTELVSLDLSANQNIYYLDCTHNSQLEFLNIKSNTFEYDYYISGNTGLRYICCDENEIQYIQNVLDYEIPNNSCVVNSYCSFTPGGTFYTIQGNTSLDSNGNGCDNMDIGIPFQKIQITNGTVTGTVTANASGHYSIPVQAGNHTITPILENPDYFTISPASTTISFPINVSPFEQNFCVTPNGNHQDLETWIVPLDPARPGFEANYKIIYKNKGNQIMSGTLNFYFDDAVMDFDDATPSQSSQSYNLLSWDYSNLNPFETREIVVVFNINSPMETPAVNDGDVLHYTATIVGATDGTPIDNTFALNQTVVNSFDPNDKTCLEGNSITPEMVGNYVHYMIRFENTGTFPATNIVVADVIDTTKFDLATLVPLHGSHSFVTRVNNTTGKVEFIFENINLPFDDANNDGYVTFKIKTKPTLVIGNSFSNTANIYFDYNFPITTNTAATTVALLNNHDFDFGSYFSIYPNPATSILHLDIKNEIEMKSVDIYNTLGQIVLVVTNPESNTAIDVSSLKTGTYFLKVNSDRGTASTKFIKE